MRNAWAGWAVALLVAAAPGCDEDRSACDKYCTASLNELADYIDDDLGCELEDKEDYIGDCVEECREALDDISADDRKEAVACMNCVWSETGDEPDYGDVEEAIVDDCEDECLDDDGMSEYWEEYDAPEVSDNDLDC